MFRLTGFKVKCKEPEFDQRVMLRRHKCRFVITMPKRKK